MFRVICVFEVFMGVVFNDLVEFFFVSYVKKNLINKVK